MGNKPASSNVRCGRGPVHPKRKFLMVGCPCSFLDFLFRPMCPSPPDMPTKNKETKIKKDIRSMRSLYSPYSPYSHLSSAPNFCFLSSFLLFCFNSLLFFFFSFCISPYLPLSYLAIEIRDILRRHAIHPPLDHKCPLGEDESLQN